jgi:hypothetical protein
LSEKLFYLRSTEGILLDFLLLHRRYALLEFHELRLGKGYTLSLVSLINLDSGLSLLEVLLLLRLTWLISCRLSGSFTLTLRHGRGLIEIKDQLLEDGSQVTSLLVPLHEGRALVGIGASLNELMSDTTADGQDGLFMREIRSESHLDIDWGFRHR